MTERMSNTSQQLSEAWYESSNEMTTDEFLVSRPEAQTDEEVARLNERLSRIEAAKAGFDYDDLSREERADLASEAVKAGELSTALEAMSRMSMPELVELGRDLKENNLPHELVTSSLHAHFQEKANRGEIAEEKVAGYVDRAEKLITGERDEVKVSIFSDEEKAAARAPYASILAAKKETVKLDELEPTVPTAIEPDAPEPASVVTPELDTPKPADPTENAPVADDEENQPTDPEQKDDADDTAANLGTPIGENAPAAEAALTPEDISNIKGELAVNIAAYNELVDKSTSRLAVGDQAKYYDALQEQESKAAAILDWIEGVLEGNNLPENVKNALHETFTELETGHGAVITELERLEALNAPTQGSNEAEPTAEPASPDVADTPELETEDLLEQFDTISAQHEAMRRHMYELDKIKASAKTYDLEKIKAAQEEVDTVFATIEAFMENNKDKLTDLHSHRALLEIMKSRITGSIEPKLEKMRQLAEYQEADYVISEAEVVQLLGTIENYSNKEAVASQSEYDPNDTVDDEPKVDTPEASGDDEAAKTQAVTDDIVSTLLSSSPEDGGLYDTADTPGANKPDVVDNYNLFNFSDTTETGQDSLTRRQRASRKIGSIARKRFGYGSSR